MYSNNPKSELKEQSYKPAGYLSKRQPEAPVQAGEQELTLFTTVRMELFLSSSTWPMTCLYGSSSSLRFR